MKKLIIILLIFSSLKTIAQGRFNNNYYFGINSGLNISRLNIDPSVGEMFNISTDQRFIFSYSGGIVFIYYSEPHKGLQIELNYSRKGWIEDWFYKRELHYFEFPFLSHFDISVKKLNLSITVGPTMSYLISSQEQSDYIEEFESKSYYNIDIDNKFEGGLSIGLGANKFTRKGLIQFECRLNQGLSNLFSKERDLDISISQNQVIGIKISYLFGWR